MPNSEQASEFDALKLTCSSTQCQAGLHYFGPAYRKKSPHPLGRCLKCGIELVNWPRVQERAVGDIAYLIEMLRLECWRHDWWDHRPIDPVAQNHARRKGANVLHEDAKHILRKYVCTLNRRDGVQTRTKGNIIAYAQHATATCCRKCLAYWHGLPVDGEVSDDDLNCLAEVIMTYVRFRMPDLAQEGIHVPRRPPPTKGSSSPPLHPDSDLLLVAQEKC